MFGETEQHISQLTSHPISSQFWTIKHLRQWIGSRSNVRPLILVRARPGGLWFTNTPVLETIDPVLKVTESRQ
jgi:hypothetical protein